MTRPHLGAKLAAQSVLNYGNGRHAGLVVIDCDVAQFVLCLRDGRAPLPKSTQPMALSQFPRPGSSPRFLPHAGPHPGKIDAAATVNLWLYHCPVARNLENVGRGVGLVYVAAPLLRSCFCNFRLEHRFKPAGFAAPQPRSHALKIASGKI